MFGRKQSRHTVVETLIGSNSKINGDLHFKGGCHIDGTVNGSEECDGASLGGETCVSQGFDSGTLSCLGGCVFDSTGCQAW